MIRPLRHKCQYLGVIHELPIKNLDSM
jgi:hypothetical protein